MLTTDKKLTGSELIRDCIDMFLGPDADDPDVVRLTSPLERVRGSEPPFLFLVGDADVVTPVGLHEEMCRRLRAAGGTAEMTVYPEAGHGFGYGVTAEVHKASHRRAADFLDRLLVSRPTS